VRAIPLFAHVDHTAHQKTLFPNPIKFGGRIGCIRRRSSAEIEKWENEWLTAPLRNELVQPSRLHQGAHDHVR